MVWYVTFCWRDCNLLHSSQCMSIVVHFDLHGRVGMFDYMLLLHLDLFLIGLVWLRFRFRRCTCMVREGNSREIACELYVTQGIGL